MYMAEEQTNAQTDGMPDCFSPDQVKQLVDYYNSEIEKSVLYLENMSSLVESYYESPEKNLSADQLEEVKKQITDLKTDLVNKKEDFFKKIVEITENVQCNTPSLSEPTKVEDL